MTTNPKPDIAALLLRLALGLVLLAHSQYLKLMVYTLTGTAEFFADLGLPGGLAYAVFLLEVVTGFALLLGVHTRLCAAAVLPVLLGATWAHAANGWLFTNPGGGWEYPLLLTVLCIVQWLLGDGRYALGSLNSIGVRGVAP